MSAQVENSELNAKRELCAVHNVTGFAPAEGQTGAPIQTCAVIEINT